MSTATITPREVIVRAEKRLTPMVARGAAHEDVLATFRHFEVMHERAIAGQAGATSEPAEADPFAAVVELFGEEPVVAPALLTNRRLELARRGGVS